VSERGKFGRLEIGLIVMLVVMFLLMWFLPR
jgi:hypothetical protein